MELNILLKLKNFTNSTDSNKRDIIFSLFEHEVNLKVRNSRIWRSAILKLQKVTDAEN